MIRIEQTRFKPPPRLLLSDGDRNQIVRDTISEIENRMNSLDVNKTYQMAFKLVRRMLQQMKP